VKTPIYEFSYVIWTLKTFTTLNITGNFRLILCSIDTATDFQKQALFRCLDSVILLAGYSV